MGIFSSGMSEGEVSSNLVSIFTGPVGKLNPFSTGQICVSGEAIGCTDNSMPMRKWSGSKEVA